MYRFSQLNRTEQSIRSKQNIAVETSAATNRNSNSNTNMNSTETVAKSTVASVSTTEMPNQATVSTVSSVSTVASAASFTESDSANSTLRLTPTGCSCSNTILTRSTRLRHAVAVAPYEASFEQKQRAPSNSHTTRNAFHSPGENAGNENSADKHSASTTTDTVIENNQVRRRTRSNRPTPLAIPHAANSGTIQISIDESRRSLQIPDQNKPRNHSRLSAVGEDQLKSIDPHLGSADANSAASHLSKLHQQSHSTEQTGLQSTSSTDHTATLAAAPANGTVCTDSPAAAANVSASADCGDSRKQSTGSASETFSNGVAGAAAAAEELPETPVKELSVRQLAELLRVCGLERVASLCEVHKIDGGFFTELGERDFLAEPFSLQLNSFEFKRIQRLQRGFFPKLD